MSKLTMKPDRSGIRQPHKQSGNKPQNEASFSVLWVSSVFLGLNIVLTVLWGPISMIAAVPAWRLSKLTLECAIEGSFRFVSDVGGDFRNTSRSPFE
jgi:hypothetical protein